jgi:hypothetical protein
MTQRLLHILLIPGNVSARDAPQHASLLNRNIEQRH